MGLRENLKKYEDILLYLVFGALTTAVNWIVYFPLLNYANVSATVATVIAWAVSVVFAFLTNKPIVFKSRDWSLKTVMPELAGFVGCRIGSGAFETIAILLTVDILHWNGNIMKIIVSVLVVIINYIGSKLLFGNGKKNSKG